MKHGAVEKHHLFLRTLIILIMILAAAALRIAPHPWNFTPVGAMAIFSGAMLRNRWLAFLLPLLAIFTGDLFIGFYNFAVLSLVYGSFLVNVAIGRLLEENRTVGRIGGATFLGSLQFFAVSNFAVWAFLGSFPRTVAGLAACYASGLPLFRNTLAGDTFYVVLLFGGFALAERFVMHRTACS
jgi:hypothetical protein